MPTLHEFENQLPRISFRHAIDIHPLESEFLMHVHDEYEILYLISGQTEFAVEDTVYPLTPGSLIITRPMEAHCVHILGDIPYERYCINFSPVCLQDIDPENRLLIPFHSRALGSECMFSPKEMSRISAGDLTAAMCDEISLPDASVGQALTYLFPLLNEISRAFERRSKHRYSAPKTTEEQLVSFVDLHLFEDISIEKISDHFYLSPSQVSRLFKKATGVPLWEYVLSKRFAYAKKMISGGTSPHIAANAVGFKDYSVFFRGYVKRFGNSPSRA